MAAALRGLLMADDRKRDEPGGSPPPREPEVVIPAERLFGDRREVWIEHNGERYRLRITRRGRLILQK
jgi:hemin uptake protein HemP